MMMRSNRSGISLAAAGLLLGASLVMPGFALAHCDALDGPVVTAAKQALEQKDVNAVLAWVRASDEPAIRAAFQHTLAVRAMGAQARDLADTYFFETLVRVHREGEGAPYTGLKPAGLDVGPAIPAADGALRTGDLAPLEHLLLGEAGKGLRHRFEEARAARNHSAGDVAAGRRYVEKYVTFLHYAENLHRLASPAPARHEPRDEAEKPHQH